MAILPDIKKKRFCGSFTPTFSFIILIFLLFTTSCKKELINTQNINNRPAKRIISLYSAHSENLFALGLDDEIIGVYKFDNITEAKNKKKYDYRDDPERIIEASPDLVLIRPFIERGYPNFIKTLKDLNIRVVSLYPDTIEDFDDYIMTLGKLTGKEKKAKKMLKNFNNELQQIKHKTQVQNPKVKVYFESTANNYRTVSQGSLPDCAIKIAGGLNIAEDAMPIKKGSSIAFYGEEKILEKADFIDIYIAQKGKMNPVVSIDNILKRSGFNVIKAVKEKNVYIIDEDIISRPTFNYLIGIKKLANIFYGEL